MDKINMGEVLEEKPLHQRRMLLHMLVVYSDSTIFMTYSHHHIQWFSTGAHRGTPRAEGTSEGVLESGCSYVECTCRSITTIPFFLPDSLIPQSCPPLSLRIIYSSDCVQYAVYNYSWILWANSETLECVLGIHKTAKLGEILKIILTLVGLNYGLLVNTWGHFWSSQWEVL